MVFLQNEMYKTKGRRAVFFCLVDEFVKLAGLATIDQVLIDQPVILHSSKLGR